MVIRNTSSVIRSLPYLINQVLELYSLLFGPSLQDHRTETFFALYIRKHQISHLPPLQKAQFLCLHQIFFKNKNHTNFIRCLDLSANQKLNENKAERRKLYKPKLLHFYNIILKVAIARNASNKKPSS